MHPFSHASTAMLLPDYFRGGKAVWRGFVALWLFKRRVAS